MESLRDAMLSGLVGKEKSRNNSGGGAGSSISPPPAGGKTPPRINVKDEKSDSADGWEDDGWGEDDDLSISDTSNSKEVSLELSKESSPISPARSSRMGDSKKQKVTQKSAERIALEKAFQHVDLSGDMEDENMSSAFVTTFEGLETDQREEVFTLLDEQSAEFASRAKELDNVQNNLTAAKAQLGNAAQFVDLENYTQKDHELTSEQSKLNQESAGIDLAIVVLEGLVEMEDWLAKADAAKSLHDRCLSLGKAVNILGSIAAPDQSAEPPIVRQVRHQIDNRRLNFVGMLKSLIPRFFDCRELEEHSRGINFVSKIDNVVIDANMAAGTLSFDEFWACARALEAQEEVLQVASSHFLSTMLSPLLADAAAIDSWVNELAVRPTNHSTAWAYYCDRKSNPDGTPAPPILPEASGVSVGAASTPATCVTDVFPVLESLFSFLKGRFDSFNASDAGTSASDDTFDIYVEFGKKVWPVLVRGLLSSRKFYLSWEDGPAICAFEKKMVENGIGYGSNLRKAADNKSFERFKMLERGRLLEVRDLFSCSDFEEERLTNAVDVTSTSENFKKCKFQEGVMTPADKDFGGKLGHLEEMFMELIHIPTCTVSKQSRQYVNILHEVISDSLSEWQSGRKSEALRLLDFLKSLLAVFTMMRPHAQRARLKSDPATCALFFNDCMYVSHKILMLPHYFEKLLPKQMLSKLLRYINFITDIRYLAEYHFLQHVQYQCDKIEGLLEQTNGFLNVSSQQQHHFTQTAIGSIIGHIQGIVAGWSRHLPLQVFQRAVGRVYDHLANLVLRDIFQLNSNACSTQDTIIIKQFLTELVEICSKMALMRADDQDEPPQKEPTLERVAPNHWQAFVIVKDLLCADLETFTERKQDWLLVLSPDQAKRLMDLNGVRNVNQAYQRILVG